jgi:1,4-dihydroxy-2-naphthoyl-CoA hydrolase
MDLTTENTLMEALGITISSISNEEVVATMPVDNRTRQSYGMLHGGASVALAETVASVGTYYLIDRETEICVGMEINANHIRGKESGIVTAYAKPAHRGKSTMVWEIKIVDEEDKLICISRCTMAVLKKQSQ